jgi:farnesyl diphosphate synthase
MIARASGGDFAERLDGYRNRVDAELSEILHSVEDVPDRLRAAMEYSVLGGGKRVRPLLAYASGELCGVEPSALDVVAAAVELVHAYSLVHDDLPAMDDALTRRGRPSCHRQFDEATAILAGDALLTLAFGILSEPRTHPEPSVRVALIGLLAKAAGVGGMAGGQALDLAAEGQNLGPMDVARMQAMKTGALFDFACAAGAVLGRADDVAREALAAYASAFGQAFQLADDILDAEGDAAAMGKATAKDARRGKATLVALLGIDAARARLKALVDDAEAALAPFGERALTLRQAARFIASRRA